MMTKARSVSHRRSTRKTSLRRKIKRRTRNTKTKEMGYKKRFIFSNKKLFFRVRILKSKHELIKVLRNPSSKNIRWWSKMGII